jgi:hypothetical protein
MWPGRIRGKDSWRALHTVTYRWERGTSTRRSVCRYRTHRSFGRLCRPNNAAKVGLLSQFAELAEDANAWSKLWKVATWSAGGAVT